VPPIRIPLTPETAGSPASLLALDILYPIVLEYGAEAGNEASRRPLDAAYNIDCLGELEKALNRLVGILGAKRGEAMLFLQRW
jgi:hypothetical protein